MSTLPRPAEHEYAEYYRRYVEQVPDGDILETLRDQLGDTLALLQSVSPEGETFRYADGKWSLREVVGHLVDTEWLFAFRALAMAREEGVDLPGMDQDVWVTTSGAGEHSLDTLCGHWAALRRATVYLFAMMTEAHGARTGVASGNSFTVRSFAWIIAGHELWHRRLMEEHYVGGGA